MSTHTLIVTLALPSDNAVVSKPHVMLVWPGGSIEKFTLNEHDWSADSWDWRNGHLPTSLLRRLREMHFAEDTAIHGSRVAYVSPQHVGISSNETGRVMVYELDYEV